MELPIKAKEIYPDYQWEAQAKRYTTAAARFAELFGEPHQMIFSTSGRSEICGNHTDHNMGKAVGASIDLDILAMVSPRNDGLIRVLADGFSPVEVDTADSALREKEKGGSTALLRGIVAKMNVNVSSL